MPLLDLRYVENPDVAFSFFGWVGTSPSSWHLALLAAASGAAMAMLWWRARRERFVVQVGYAAIVAGAIGNVVDRVLRGRVVDFVHVYGWPVFNVADIAVVSGGLLLLVTASVEALRARRLRRRRPSSESTG